MSAIVWTTLITAIATVTGSLGAVWIKIRYDDRAQARQAEQNSASAREDQQRQAYGELVKTARLALGRFRQLRLAYAADKPNVPAIIETLSQSASLAADLNQAAALAELVGSPGGRQHARIIYQKAAACADLFQGHEPILAPASDTPLGQVLRPAISAAIGKTIPFDGRKAKVLCDELEAAIDQFIETVTTELRQ
jgi:hypothetical protein